MRFITKLGSACCLTLALGVVGACNRAPDPSDQVSKALKNASLDNVKVDWDKDARIAHLKGTVDQATDRQRAEDVAQAAVGTSGRVLNEVTVKNVNERTADDLDSGIKKFLKDSVDKDKMLSQRDINFDVNNGVVTIKGDVRTAAEKTRVSEIAREAPGVKNVANALEIKKK
ncbi:MAG TPA: BON domain-containing protein [Vicinamibacterales bacterium]|jgi:osmotically-inducible protein OsmY